MKFLWPVVMNLMLILTGITMLTGIVLNHDIDAIMLRSSMVLMGSGLVLMFIGMWITRNHQRQQLAEIKKQQEQQPSKPVVKNAKTSMAA